VWNAGATLSAEGAVGGAASGVRRGCSAGAPAPPLWKSTNATSATSAAPRRANWCRGESFMAVASSVTAAASAARFALVGVFGEGVGPGAEDGEVGLRDAGLGVDEEVGRERHLAILHLL